MAASTAPWSVVDVESFIREYYDAWSGTDEDRILSSKGYPLLPDNAACSAVWPGISSLTPSAAFNLASLAGC